MPLADVIEFPIRFLYDSIKFILTIIAIPFKIVRGA